MNTSTLFPPNREQFSDAVIGSLMQRNEHYPSNNIQRTEWRTTKVSRQSYSAALATSALPAVPNACKRLLSDKVCGQITISNERKMRAGVDYSDAKHSADVELRRQRNRMHQARYKMKQRQLVADLEAAVTHLRQEIQELEIQQRLLSYGLPTTTTIWNIAAEYFRLFRHGTKGSTMVENAHIEPALNLLHSQVQWDFMKTTMAPDVTDGVVIGIDALIESHALQSRCYEAIDLQPLRMDDGPEGLLIVSTQCELTITENMLVCGFPNLVKDGEWSSLADKMLGKKIVIYGSTHFFWDNTRGRVVRLQWKADVMTALLRLLGSLDTVPQVFNGARMSPEGMVKPSL
ncbi:hypothetical protein PPTG_03047 [Phytophthora nicotianae INRA-310]|uniref:BZIP domain-containing protein n=1 Tax=Phytophthora nicotianae (strain INRA-310) TaxID=761204 RepID=W2R5Z3_PHYN3|nr:hypothetical protein PPTG_03047 [Phytophthora nicotianae INRA-310]ETN19935.1 hypothetical protein PPTG_03047 [Phytophthora nicotianae INRA-310]